MICDESHARVQCKITRVLQCNLKMDPSKAGSDPNSARLGRIRPCLGRLAGANDPCWADLGVHPTRFRSIWGCIRPVLGRSDPMKLSNIPLCFQCFFENGPDPKRIQPGFDPTRSDPTRVGTIWGCIRFVFGRFRRCNGSDGPDPTR